MQQERLVELLVALHDGLPRLGPGNAATTLRALSLCEGLPAKPDILDIGCGTGAQTMVLAAATGGHVTACDLFGQFLEKLVEDAEEQGLDNIRSMTADMRDLPFDDASFDLIWSEGAIYNVGFDKGLAEWRRLVRPGGWLVVSEVSWFSPNPPEDLKAFWDKYYPPMRDVAGNLAAVPPLGWDMKAHFHLPVEAWTEDYHGPVAERLPEFRAAFPGDEDAEAVALMTEQEMAFMRNYPEHYGYEFYIMQRRD